MDTGQQVPLVELLQKVPINAVFHEHTPNPLGFDVTHYQVGAYCHDAAVRIAALEAKAHLLRRERDEVRACIDVSADRIAELEAALERERMRLAACGVVAMANTRDSADKARQMQSEYRSASLCDVERAVDMEMAERERREAAEWVLKEIRIRLHAAGRRSEECWEMSEIDGHLAQFASSGPPHPTEE